MPKTLTIEANTRSGERGFVEVSCPMNLDEAVEMFGKTEVFKGFIRDRVIIWQRDARPVATKDADGNEKPKKRLSVYDRLNQS